MRLIAFAVSALWAVAACSAPISDHQPIETQTSSKSPADQGRPTLWFVGLAMQDETWSENDVVETAQRLGQVATRFRVQPVLFDNHEKEPSHAVEGRRVEQSIGSIARNIAPNDVVLIYASTHGAPGLLGLEADGQEQEPVGIADLQRWLAPLQGHDTVLVLSACFAGSFIPALKSEHRIIFTAARADRTSFGCQAGAAHTVFGEAFLQALAPNRSLHAIVDRTQAAVRVREHEMGVTDPSLPQISVGSDVRRLYDARLF